MRGTRSLSFLLPPSQNVRVVTGVRPPSWATKQQATEAMHGRQGEELGPSHRAAHSHWRATVELERERNKLDSLIWGRSVIWPYRVLTKSLRLGGPF